MAAEEKDLAVLEATIAPFSEGEKLLWSTLLGDVKEQLERLEDAVAHQRARLSHSVEYGQLKGMTWAEIGTALGVSRERARQIAGK